VTITPTAGNAAANITDISGDLNVTGGTFNIGLNDAFVGGLTGTGTVANGSTTSRWITVGTGNNDTTFNGTLVDGAGATSAGGILGLRKRGSGTLTLTGANTLSDQLNIESGRVLLTGSIIPGNHITNGGDVRIGANNTPGITNGILDIQGGTLQAPKNNAPSIQVGGNNGTYTTAGALRIGPGSTVTSASEVWLGRADGGYGALDMTGGTFTIGSWFAVGRDGGQGVVNLSGGALNVTSQQVTIGSFLSRSTALHNGEYFRWPLRPPTMFGLASNQRRTFNMLPAIQLSPVRIDPRKTPLPAWAALNCGARRHHYHQFGHQRGRDRYFQFRRHIQVSRQLLFITGLTHAYTYSGGRIDSMATTLI
jgi:autotransporter-associated beta strand protein